MILTYFGDQSNDKNIGAKKSNSLKMLFLVIKTKKQITIYIFSLSNICSLMFSHIMELEPSLSQMYYLCVK